MYESQKNQKMKPIHFKAKEYPEIIVEETHFKIKAIDYWEFRSFNFDEVVSVELINPQKRWYYQLYFIFSLMARIFANEEPLLLRITKKNGGVWDYQYKNEYNASFRTIVKEISKKIEKN